MITLHQFEVSPFCDKIRRVLHWKKQPYELHDVSLWQALTQVRRPNPVGKLPCLEHDGRCYELRLRLGTREKAPR